MSIIYFMTKILLRINFQRAYRCVKRSIKEAITPKKWVFIWWRAIAFYVVKFSISYSFWLLLNWIFQNAIETNLCLQKADKEHLDSKVNRNQFELTCNELNQMISDLINKLLGTVSIIKSIYFTLFVLAILSVISVQHPLECYWRVYCFK